MILSMKGKIPDKQIIRYVIVGTWNTFFGYAVYAFFTYMLTGLVPHAYIFASVIANVISITVAYIGHKFFVFKTKGNYLREYMKFYAVYGVAVIVNITLLPFVVAAVSYVTNQEKYSPYIAGIILTSITVICSFFGHKNFSFRS